MSFAYLPWYTGDYLRDTRALSMAGHGCYLLLLAFCWDSRGPLPLEQEEIAAICGARSQEERATMDRVLGKFFVKMADGWYNERMDMEIAKCNAISGVRSEAGRKGYQAKAKQVLSKSQASATNPNPIPSPAPTPSLALDQTPKSKPLRRAVAQTPTSEAWRAYSQAYFNRYGVEPVWNAKVGGHFASLIRRVGAVEAPGVAAHFLLSQRSQYVVAKHPASLLDRDAESLRTEWATRTHGTESEARSGDRTAGRGNVFTELIEEARNGKK